MSDLIDVNNKEKNDDDIIPDLYFRDRKRTELLSYFLTTYQTLLTHYYYQNNNT